MRKAGKVLIQQSVSLAPLTWWKIGGPAEYFTQPTSVEALMSAQKWALEKGVAVTALGGGSNVLVSDQGVKGLVISLKNLSGIEQQTTIGGRLQIVALAGTGKSETVKIFLQHKLAPALFLCGLPGDLGGGVVMNAGVGEMIAPREFCEIVDWIEVVQVDKGAPSLKRFTKDQIHWEYRHSSGWQPGIIARVAISWPLEPDLDIPMKVRLATRNRLQKQPLEWPSCGSTFRNPPGHKAGALIEQAGLKGFQVGAAQVSEKHANFIINRGGATARDVLEVIKTIQKRVKTQFDISLETEVRLIGEF